MKDDEPVVSLHYESKSVSRTWKPVSLEGFEDNPGVDGDFPSLNNYSKIPIFSNRAWEALRPLVGYCSEALPVTHPGGHRYWIINVTDVIDCVDEKRSNFKRYSDGGVMRVVSFHFKENTIQNKHIFKTPKKSGADLIVDDAFRATVEKNGLQGLLFERLSAS
jgi:hypothetical protein